MFYEIVNDLVDIPSATYSKPEISRTRARHQRRLQQYSASTDCYKHSFLSRQLWCTVSSMTLWTSEPNTFWPLLEHTPEAMPTDICSHIPAWIPTNFHSFPQESGYGTVYRWTRFWPHPLTSSRLGSVQFRVSCGARCFTPLLKFTVVLTRMYINHNFVRRCSRGVLHLNGRRRRCSTMEE